MIQIRDIPWWISQPEDYKKVVDVRKLDKDHDIKEQKHVLSVSDARKPEDIPGQREHEEVPTFGKCEK